MAQERNTSRRTQGQRQAPSRRNDMNYCENCGEYYAKTYKRCPFCDERSGAAGGRRAARNTRGGGYGSSAVTPIQMVYLVVSLIFIIAALFIVLTKLGPLFFGDDDPPAASSSPSSSTSQSSTPGAEITDPPAASTPSVEPPAVTVEAIVLSREDFTLNPGEPYKVLAATSPAEVTEPVVWSSSDPTLATVDQDGTVTNVNQTIELRNVTITATCGGREATCIVRCKPGGTDPGPGIDPGPGNPSGPVPKGTMGTIVNASAGLNIRSGPGSNYKKIASATNGSKVKIIEDPQNGWYKIEYGNNLTGYVSSDYVSVTY